MSTEITEAAILEALHKVPQEKWDRVLKFLNNLAPKTGRAPEGADAVHWTAEELLALPLAERGPIIEAQALSAVDLYPVGLDDDYSDYLDETDAPAR